MQLRPHILALSVILDLCMQVVIIQTTAGKQWSESVYEFPYMCKHRD